MTPPFILASSSPQRRLLLEQIGCRFTVQPSSLDEASCTERHPLKRAQCLARLKAQEVAQAHTDAFVLGADTLVVAADGTLLEKPASDAEALFMLQKHSGQTSMVHSALCLLAPDGGVHEGVSTSAVRFRTLSPVDEQWWLETGLWRDRSGGFQIDGPGQLLIEHLDGDYTGVVGLPIFLLGQLCEVAGYPLQSQS